MDFIVYNIVLQVITMLELRRFLEEHQGEDRTDEELRSLLDRHEPDPTLRSVNWLLP